MQNLNQPDPLTSRVKGERWSKCWAVKVAMSAKCEAVTSCPFSLPPSVASLSRSLSLSPVHQITIHIHVQLTLTASERELSCLLRRGSSPSSIRLSLDLFREPFCPFGLFLPTEPSLLLLLLLLIAPPCRGIR